MTGVAHHTAQLQIIDSTLEQLGLNALAALVPRNAADAEGQAWFAIVVRLDAPAAPRLLVESRGRERLEAAAAWVTDADSLTPPPGGLTSLITDGTADGTSTLRLAGSPHQDNVGRTVMGTWRGSDGLADDLIVVPGALPETTPSGLAALATPWGETDGLWLSRQRNGQTCGLLRVLEISDQDPSGAVLDKIPAGQLPGALHAHLQRLLHADHRLGPAFWWVEPDGSQHLAVWTRPDDPRRARNINVPPDGDLSRWWQVSDTSSRVVQFTLDFRGAPCRQACRFCPESWNLEPDRSTQDYDVAALTAAFAAHLDQHTQPHIYFCSGDVLRSNALFPILDAVVAAGRTITLSTPGAELADDALVGRLAAYPVDFDLTWLADDDATWAAIVGREDIPGEVRAGLRNLRARDLPVTVSVVVTSLNVARLLPTLRQLRDVAGFSKVLLRGFYPDAQDTPSDYLELYPAWSELSKALDDLAADAAPMELSLSNVPPCQLRPSTVEKLRIRLEQAENTHRAEAPHPECARCVFADTCVRIPPSYPASRAHQPRSARAAARVAAALQPNELS